MLPTITLTRKVRELWLNRANLERKSYWLISNERWAEDLANRYIVQGEINIRSGIHNIISSNEDVNVLVIDGENYSKTFGRPRARAKKDIGLYAMNYGTSFGKKFTQQVLFMWHLLPFFPPIPKHTSVFPKPRTFQV